MNRPVLAVRRAAERYRTDQPGITSWHCFSAGSHYDPDNVGFGPLIACDAHVLAAGAGFPIHRHAGVVIVSWPVSGLLLHEGGDGRSTRVAPGTAQILRTGAGVEHAESAGDQSVDFVQLALLSDLTVSSSYETVTVDPDRPSREAVVTIADVLTPDGLAGVSVVRATPTTVRWEAGARRFLFVVRGVATVTVEADEFLPDGAVTAAASDSVRIEARTEVELTAEPGPAELLMITLP